MTLHLAGQRFGRLVALRLGPKRGRIRTYICACDCGSTVTVLTDNLRRLRTQSCGCHAREWASAVNLQHGHSTKRSGRTPTYQTWRGMKARCFDPNSISYPRYGGRGVTVCPEWRDSFEAFLLDMGDRPPGTTLDRRDPNGHYEPSNCRWASAKEQVSNRRPIFYKLSTDPTLRAKEMLEAGQSVAAVSRLFGVAHNTVTRAIERVSQ
jgi:hypothetical protein